MKKVLSIMVLLVLALVLLTGCTDTTKKRENFKIVTSFYPIYTIASSLSKGIDDVTVENMASTNIGCLHDYTLTTADLKKIEDANIFIFNGLGIENFIIKILLTYPDMIVINSSQNIDEENAHIWLNIDKYIMQVENVKQGLIDYDSKHKSEYEKNAKEYIEKLNELKTRMENGTKKEKKCLSFSESLEHLGESTNLNIKTIDTDHEQNGLSAETMAEAIRYVKENNIKNIIIDKQTAENNAKTVASETGAKIYVLDSLLGGEADYIETMGENLKIVESME